MRKILNTILLTAVMAVALGTKSVNAQYYSQSNVNKSVSIDKKVRNVHENTYFDNIDLTREVFYEGDLIEFKVTVNNNGSVDLANVSIGDSLPASLGLIFYPGTLDKSTNNLAWGVDSLKPGESRDYLIRAKISDVSKVLKNGTATMLMVNKSDVGASGVYDKDSASYYVGIKTVPKTGDSSLIIKTMTIISALVVALYLRKFARGY